jgi:hypothetical protein
MALAIGQSVLVRGSSMTVRVIEGAGTVVVESASGNFFRVSGLSSTDVPPKSFPSIIAATPRPKRKAERIALQCNECGRKWKVSPNSDPQCSRCNSVDFEVLS